MSLVSDADSFTDAYKISSFQSYLTALSIVDGLKPFTSNQDSEHRKNSTNSQNQESNSSNSSSIRPCLVCGVSVVDSGKTNTANSQLKTLENVWTSSSSLVSSSSSLVRAMNSVNSAASNSLDIMKVADSAQGSSSRSYFLILCDFHHKLAQPQTSKKDGTKDSKTKKAVSGTGTSTSSNGDRQESLYQEILLGKFLLEEINEDVDSEMVGSTHFDSIYAAPHAVLSASSGNGIFYGMPIGAGVPSSSYDANSNPVNNSLEQLASSSKMNQLRKTLDTIKTTKAEPAIVQSVRIEAPDFLKITNIIPTKDGKHLFVTLCPQVEGLTPDSYTNSNQMDIDDESKFFKKINKKSLNS